MTSIDVHGNIGEIELLKSICYTALVVRFGSLASCQVGVGDQIGKGVGLDDQSNGDIRGSLDSGNKCFSTVSMRESKLGSGPHTINVVRLVLGKLARCKFSVGGLGSTITSWEIVDDETQDIGARSLCEHRSYEWDSGNCIARFAISLVLIC